jgi:hypothetical protein
MKDAIMGRQTVVFHVLASWLSISFCLKVKDAAVFILIPISLFLYIPDEATLQRDKQNRLATPHFLHSGRQ